MLLGMTRQFLVGLALIGIGSFSVCVSNAGADDWPMWRFDATRSAASTNALPDQFNLIWKRKFTPRQQAWDDPLNLDLMPYDRQFEPIVMDGRLLMGFNDQNKLVAFDADTGAEIWTAYAEAPVRLPPAGWKDRVFFCSDDGFLYCIEVATGKLLWKFRGAPNAQHAIGNRRLISVWPARGGPVVRDDTVYFAASIWPMMGTFIYALDADTGEVRWVNDSTGAQYIKQPHSAPSFAGVAPQGAMVATKEMLIVPGGRSVPATFDRADGKFRYFEINAGGKGTGGSFVTANESHFFVHTRGKGTRAFKLKDGIKTSFMPSEPVIHHGMIYSAEKSKDDKALIRAYGSDQKVVWELPADGTKDLILVGGRLVAAGADSISIIRLPKEDTPAKVDHKIPMNESVERVIVADNKLFVVTLDGQVMAFGDGQPQQSVPTKQQKLVSPTEEAKQAVSRMLAAGEPEGYGLWFGDSNSKLVHALAADSPFVQLAVVDSAPDAVAKMNRRLDAWGRRANISVHHSELGEFKAPQYIANMIFVDRDRTSDSDIKRIYNSVRPFGGVMHVLSDGDRNAIAATIKSMNLEQASVEVGDDSVIVRRVGALPGSADWTHQYGDVANTIKSNDRRVKLPLGVLWFGGSSNMDVLPRHGHGPPEQVIGGRLFIQGMNSLSARDVYTGRVLWKREFKDLGTFDVYYDKTYENTPLNPKYNQVHIPGANGRGTNYVATDDRVYLIEANVCHVLDPASGKTLTEIKLPASDSDEVANWGYIGVYKDVLIGGFGFAKYAKRRGLKFEGDKDLKDNRAGFGSKSLDRAASIALVGFDRHSGKLLWQVDAKHSFWHNGIVAGGDQIYCLDRNPSKVEQAMLRRGIPRPDTYRILAMDYQTGKPNWEIKEGIFGTWLSYSQQHDLLLQAGASASDRLSTESGSGMAVYNAVDGQLRWEKKSLKYAGPCILHNDLIITNANSYSVSAGAFYLRDGKQKMVTNPITGKTMPWKVTRAYGCNNIIASENFLTFRSGAAGFYDLLSDSGTGNLGGFKSGCTSNLVVAGGVLNAPDYTRTCSCSYQNQTSLAMVHMPDVDLWTVHDLVAKDTAGKRVENIGINFGAPGDRRDTNGRLWLEFPIVAGTSPPIQVDFNDDAEIFQHHSSTMADSQHPWIFASGVKNVTDVRVRMKLKAETKNSNEIRVGHANDDAEEAEDGKVNLGSSDLELVEDSGDQVIGVRFNKIKLKRNTKIRSAYLQFTCDEPSNKPTTLIIAGENTGDAKRFRNEPHDLTSRSRTKAEVDWEPEPWTIIGASAKAHRTPDLAPIIRSVIQRKDWKSGNSLAFLISGSGKRVASAYRKEKKNAAKLILNTDTSKNDAKEKTKPESYQVRLFYGLPKSGQDDVVFDVIVQGKQVLKDVTLSQTGDQPRFAVSTLDDIAIADDLKIQFQPKQGQAVLCGIEIQRSKNK